MAKAADDDRQERKKGDAIASALLVFGVAFCIQYEKVMLWHMMPWMSNINQTEPIRRSHSHISLRFPGCCSVGE